MAQGDKKKDLNIMLCDPNVNRSWLRIKS